MRTKRLWPWGSSRLALAVVPIGIGAGAMMVVGQGASAQQAATLNGAPQQVIPYASEPGVPTITIAPGTLNPFPSDGSDGTGTGDNGSSGTGSVGGTGGDSTALNTMENTPWGLQAIQNATALGLNPSALAATCVMESGCGANVGSGSGAQGVFQMYPAAFQEGLQTALAANPSLAPQIVQGAAGMNDPTTEAIAASGYLMQANQALQDAGITNPNVVQARGYYNFGPSNGIELAQASPNETMAQAMPNVSQATLASNGISAGETVAQWQASVGSKIGSAAGQTVLM
jgi:hypothetical protein